MSNSQYPLDHGRGYSPLPNDVRNLAPLMRDQLALTVWVWLLTKANYEAGWASGSGGDVWLEAGQMICGEREIAEALGVPSGNKNKIARRLKKLARLGLITRKADHRGTIVTIVKYGDFPGRGEGERTTGGPPADHRRTTGGPSEALKTPKAPKAPQHTGSPTGERRPRAEFKLESQSPPKKKAKKRAKKKGAHPDHGRVRARWCELYRTRYGSPPTWAAKQAGQLASLLSQHSSDEVTARMERLFDDQHRPHWINDGAGEGSFDLGRFVALFDHLAPPTPGSGARRAYGHAPARSDTVYNNDLSILDKPGRAT